MTVNSANGSHRHILFSLYLICYVIITKFCRYNGPGGEEGDNVEDHDNVEWPFHDHGQRAEEGDGGQRHACRLQNSYLANSTRWALRVAEPFFLHEATSTFYGSLGTA